MQELRIRDGNGKHIGYAMCIIMQESNYLFTVWANDGITKLGESIGYNMTDVYRKSRNMIGAAIRCKLKGEQKWLS